MKTRFELAPKTLLFLTIALLLGLAFILTLGFFERPYDIPQVLCLVSAVALLWIRPALRELKKTDWAFVLGVVALAALLPAAPFAVCCAFLLVASYFAFSDLTDSEREKIKTVIFAVAVLQGVFAIASYSNIDLAPLRKLNDAPVGTVGNPDFLASVIAAGIFILVERMREKSRIKILILLILGIGLIATKSRGTTALVALLLAWRFLPKWTVAVSTLAGVAGAVFFWRNFAGRIQLWWTCLLAFQEKPWRGHGLNNVDTAYFNQNLQRMSVDASFRSLFGPWSSQITDAHNLALQWGVEFGIAGVAVALAAWGFVITRARRNQADSDRNLALMLSIKSLYTVVLISIQNIALLSFSLSATHQKPRARWTNRAIWIGCAFLIGVSIKGFAISARNSADLRMAMSYLRIGLPDRAMPAIDRILQNSPQETDALLAKSFAFDRQGLCPQSSLYALRAVGFHQNMDVLKRAGHILFECRFYSEALELFEDLHIVFPEHRTTTMKMAWSHFYLGDYSKAEALAREIESSTPRRKSFSDERNLKEAAELLRMIRAPISNDHEMRAGSGGF